MRAKKFLATPSANRQFPADCVEEGFNICAGAFGLMKQLRLITACCVLGRGEKAHRLSFVVKGVARFDSVAASNRIQPFSKEWPLRCEPLWVLSNSLVREWALILFSGWSCIQDRGKVNYIPDGPSVQ